MTTHTVEAPAFTASCAYRDWRRQYPSERAAAGALAIHLATAHDLGKDREAPGLVEQARFANRVQELVERHFPAPGDRHYVNGVCDALSWVLGWGEEPDLPDPDDTCGTCLGVGGWTRVGSDEGAACSDCGGSGIRS